MMKLKTLNENPSLFYDLRELVEKVAKPDEALDVQGLSLSGLGDEQTGKINYPYTRSAFLASEARAILERWKKLEER